MKKSKSYKPILITISVFVITSIYITISCNAQSMNESLLALSKENHTLAIVDPATFKILAKVSVGEDPHEVIASSDGKTAYVSIYGGGSLSTINVIDLVSQKALPDIDTKPLFGPHGLTFVNSKLWFTVEGSKAIGRFNPLTSKIEWVMGTGQDRTHMIYVTNNAKKVYTTNVSSGTISIIQDTLMPPGKFPPPPRNTAQNGNILPPGMQQHENWEQIIIPVSKGCEGFDVSPDSTELWTASAEDGKIFIINLTSKKLSATINTKVNGANRLKFTPDGKLVFISSLASGNLSVYDVKSHKLLQQINIGSGAAGILMQPDGSRAYVACTPDNYVAVIDLKTLKVISHIDVGGGPDGLAWVIKY